MLILNFILVSFTLTFTFADVIPSRMFKREANLDGVVPDENILSRAEVSTELDCATACMKMDACAAYSGTPRDPHSKTSTCWLHGSNVAYVTSTVVVWGSKTYSKHSNWLERPCTTDSDCPATVANVTCFATARVCLCQPGFYFSYSRDDCVPDCATERLQPTFLRYPGYGIPDNDFLLISGDIDFDFCRRYCIKYKCRTMDVNLKDKYCNLHIVTPLSQGVSFMAVSGEELYQRTCW